MALLTPLDLAGARALGRAFGLAVTDVEALGLGSVNSNFRLSTADGKRYFARIYEEQSAEGAASELRLLTILADAGVPVARPAPARDGGGLAVHGGKPFAVFPWIDGDWLCLARVTEAHCRAVGAALARVHLASSAVGSLPEGRFRPTDMLARLERVEREGPARLGPAVALARAKYAEYAPRRVELPLGVCHGDLFRDNVLFRGGDRIAALLDFESASHGSFAYDLMVTALAWCYRGALVVEQVRALFEGYSEVRPLEARELSALEVEGALACLRFVSSRLTDFELRAPAGTAPGRDFRRFFARLEALESGVLEPIRRSLG